MLVPQGSGSRLLEHALPLCFVARGEAADSCPTRARPMSLTFMGFGLPTASGCPSCVQEGSQTHTIDSTVTVSLALLEGPVTYPASGTSLHSPLDSQRRQTFRSNILSASKSLKPDFTYFLPARGGDTLPPPQSHAFPPILSSFFVSSNMNDALTSCSFTSQPLSKFQSTSP